MWFVFSKLGPSEAKKLGHEVELRENWNKMKLQVMYDVLKAKFNQNSELKKRLIATKDAYLEEGNGWGDRYFGRCYGRGQNWLGILLMIIRDEYRNGKPEEKNFRICAHCGGGTTVVQRAEWMPKQGVVCDGCKRWVCQSCASIHEGSKHLLCLRCAIRLTEEESTTRKWHTDRLVCAATGALSGMLQISKTEGGRKEHFCICENTALAIEVTKCANLHDRLVSALDSVFHQMVTDSDLVNLVTAPEKYAHLINEVRDVLMEARFYEEND